MFRVKRQTFYLLALLGIGSLVGKNERMVIDDAEHEQPKDVIVVT